MRLLFLTDRDEAILREMLIAWRAGRLNLPSRGEAVPPEELQAPEMYIAKLQNEVTGIPPLAPPVGDGYAEPGMALCDIYQIIMSGDTPELRPVTNFEKEVYNLSTDSVLQEWIPVGRTKHGRWIALIARTVYRWGKLDEALAAGGTATVSLWHQEGGGWEGWEIDTGDNWEDVHSPPVLTEGSLDSGSWVLVGIINGRKVVLQAQC